MPERSRERRRWAARSAGRARRHDADNYKALVCIFLAGGNDGNNMVVPVDAAGYTNYAAVRGDLALPQAQLLPIEESGGCCATACIRR